MFWDSRRQFLQNHEAQEKLSDSYKKKVCNMSLHTKHQNIPMISSYFSKYDHHHTLICTPQPSSKPVLHFHFQLHQLQQMKLEVSIVHTFNNSINTASLKFGHIRLGNLVFWSIWPRFYGANKQYFPQEAVLAAIRKTTEMDFSQNFFYLRLGFRWFNFWRWLVRLQMRNKFL